MKLSQAKEYLPFVQAAAEGKTIQARHNIVFGVGVWQDLCPNFNHSFEGYDELRIKPEPKLRLWRPEEVPVGALIRSKNWIDGGPSLIVSSVKQGIHFVENWNDTCVSLHSYDSLDDCEHSLDHGKTWLPCGILEG